MFLYYDASIRAVSEAFLALILLKPVSIGLLESLNNTLN